MKGACNKELDLDHVHVCGAPRDRTDENTRDRINRHPAFLSLTLSRLMVGKGDDVIDAREFNVRKNQKAFLCAGEIDKRNANPSRNNRF